MKVLLTAKEFEMLRNGDKKNKETVQNSSEAYAVVGYNDCGAIFKEISKLEPYDVIGEKEYVAYDMLNLPEEMREDYIGICKQYGRDSEEYNDFLESMIQE